MINVVMADGAVQSITDSVDALIYTGLSTIGGGEITDGF